MKNKYKKHYIVNILLPFLTAILSFLAKSNWFNEILLQFKLDASIISKIQDICLGISVLLTSLIISVTLFIKDNKIRVAKEQSEHLIAMVKDTFNTTLNAELHQKNEFNIRIFVPHKSLLYKFLHIFNKNYPLSFVIKNHSHLAKCDKTNELSFIVFPADKAQGLVGQTYTNRKIVYDCKLDENNKTGYNLTEYQQSKTDDLKFSLTCPILNSNNEIISIVAFDTVNSVNITSQNESTICKAVNNFSRLLYESIPDYFKSEGGII